MPPADLWAVTMETGADLQIPGIHHVTAIAGDPVANANFYVGTLGLRLVKRTVNHDDEYTYHLYYGDGHGSPGTTITFFPWGDRGRPGRFGAGQTRTTAFFVPGASIDYWTRRLESHDVAFDGPSERFDETVLRFADPDGIEVELVAREGVHADHPCDGSPVPAAHQIRGIDGVTLVLADRDATGTFSRRRSPTHTPVKRTRAIATDRPRAGWPPSSTSSFGRT